MMQPKHSGNPLTERKSRITDKAQDKEKSPKITVLHLHTTYGIFYGLPVLSNFLI